jgi:hypothetical protein
LVLLQLAGIIVVNNMHLVPPSLKVIAALIVNKIDVESQVIALEAKMVRAYSLTDSRFAGMPDVQVTTNSLGHGLTISLTRAPAPLTVYGWTRLVWITELACHPICACMGRTCQINLTPKEYLEKIEKKHFEMLDRMPKV